jgi:hypothetical protein
MHHSIRKSSNLSRKRIQHNGNNMAEIELRREDSQKSQRCNPRTNYVLSLCPSKIKFDLPYHCRPGCESLFPLSLAGPLIRRAAPPSMDGRYEDSKTEEKPGQNIVNAYPHNATVPEIRMAVQSSNHDHHPTAGPSISLYGAQPHLSVKNLLYCESEQGGRWPAAGSPFSSAFRLS